MIIYVFRDHSRGDVFAFSSEPDGGKVPPVTAGTQWVLLEAIDTLKFHEPWDIGDFQEVLDRLNTDGYLFQGELIEAVQGMGRDGRPCSTLKEKARGHRDCAVRSEVARCEGSRG
jgi:hypothetical protein